MIKTDAKGQAGGYQAMKKNCWEVKSCGRCTTMSGEYACAVCEETKLHGINGGVNGGRICWTVPHKKYCGTTEGAFIDEFSSCMECDFYKMVLNSFWDDIKS